MRESALVDVRPRLASNFRDLLGGLDFGELERSPGVVFGLWPDLTLAYVNPAWYQFARENGGEPAISRDWRLGRCVMDAVPPELQPFYREFYGQQLAAEPASRIRQLEYECSSPDILRRHLMTVYRLADGRGLLVVNALTVAQICGRPTHPPYADDYHDGGGWVRQCSHCRCVEHRREPGRWDWVPFWVASPPAMVTHGLCPLCLDHFYPA